MQHSLSNTHGIKAGWKKRHFRLVGRLFVHKPSADSLPRLQISDAALMYFQDEGSAKVKGQIALQRAMQVRDEERDDKPFGFAVGPLPDGGWLHVHARSHAERAEWRNAVNAMLELIAPEYDKWGKLLTPEHYEQVAAEHHHPELGDRPPSPPVSMRYAVPVRGAGTGNGAGFGLRQVSVDHAAPTTSGLLAGVVPSQGGSGSGHSPSQGRRVYDAELGSGRTGNSSLPGSAGELVAAGLNLANDEERLVALGSVEGAPIGASSFRTYVGAGMSTVGSFSQDDRRFERKPTL